MTYQKRKETKMAKVTSKKPVAKKTTTKKVSKPTTKKSITYVKKITPKPAKNHALKAINTTATVDLDKFEMHMRKSVSTFLNDIYVVLELAEYEISGNLTLAKLFAKVGDHFEKHDSITAEMFYSILDKIDPDARHFI
jgi:hypothetical protein